MSTEQRGTATSFAFHTAAVRATQAAVGHHSSGAHHSLQGLSCPSTGAMRRLESLLWSSQHSTAQVERCHLHAWAGQRRCPKEPRATRAARCRINMWGKLEGQEAGSQSAAQEAKSDVN